MTRRAASFVVAGALLIAFVVGGALAPVPYLNLGPGPTFDALGTIDDTPLVDIQGAETFPTDGRLDITTVTESGGPYGRLGLGDALRGWLDPDVAVVPSRLIYPEDKSGEEIKQDNAADFSGAEDTAVAAAFEHVGVQLQPAVRVVAVVEGAPADGELEVGDQILRVDGARVRDPQALVDAVRAVAPGEQVRFAVDRDGERLDVRLRPEDRDGLPFVGVTPGEGFLSDVDVSFGLEGVGGPSAGLVFALSIVDQLTPGSLTGGAHVAGTGTIARDGTVGPIGGIQQKLVGARDRGATVFLVPADNCAAAAGATPDGLRTVKVTTLDSAITALDLLRDGGSPESC